MNWERTHTPCTYACVHTHRFPLPTPRHGHPPQVLSQCQHPTSPHVVRLELYSMLSWQGTSPPASHTSRSSYSPHLTSPTQAFPTQKTSRWGVWRDDSVYALQAQGLESDP